MDNKNLIEKIFSKAYKFDPLALSLVMYGKKPASFITFKFTEDISVISFKKIKLKNYPKIVFFIERWTYGCINLMIFNEDLIYKKLKVINDFQKTFNIKNANQLINLQLKFYKDRSNKKKWEFNRHLDFSSISGICFGFPLQNIREFNKEILSRIHHKGRKVYRIRTSPSLVFIGYPNTIAQSSKLLKSWLKHRSKFLKI